MTTKERITEEALTLFSTKGYKGTSVKDIAEAVGIKDASLYKHFKSKQEIFDSIVALISDHISDLSKQLGMPQYDGSYGEASDFYKKLSLSNLTMLSRKVFLFYLTDPYISRFWKLAHMEQYQNPQIYEMFHRIFMDNAIAYQTQLFSEMMEQGVFYKGDARAAAINFYAPIFLLLNIYAGQSEKAEEALAILEKQIEEFYRLYRVK
ncbi:MAG: TetR/AcrR family transcriptional regulator [Roseburia sp.]